jgi:hypothetical protein
MEQLCDMAYFQKDVCEELWIIESGSFETTWKQYDAYEPTVVPELKRLYITKDFPCGGVWSFLREIFPNCEVIEYDAF